MEKTATAPTMQREARLKTVAGVHQTRRRRRRRAVIQKIIKNNWKTQRVAAAYGHCLFTGAHNFLGFYRNRVAQSGLIRANKYWIVAARKDGKEVGPPPGKENGRALGTT